MKKSVKAFILLLLFLGVFPAIAGFAVMSLWNLILTSACGFAAIGFWQGVGLFILGQILTGGFILGLFLIGSGIHMAGHRHGIRHSHWHDMTDEQRREFIERRKEFFGFRKHSRAKEDAAE